MNVNSISYAAVASRVWSSVSRKLTGFGSMISGPVQLGATSLATSSQMDLRTVASVNFREWIIGVESAGAGFVGIWDGSVQISILAVTAAGEAQYFAPSGASVGLLLKNTDATHALTYMYVYNEWVF